MLPSVKTHPAFAKTMPLKTLPPYAVSPSISFNKNLPLEASTENVSSLPVTITSSLPSYLNLDAIALSTLERLGKRKQPAEGSAGLKNPKLTLPTPPLPVFRKLRGKLRYLERLLGCPVLHLRLKPLIEHIPLESPLPTDLRTRNPTFPGQLIDSHDVKPEVSCYLLQRHNVILWVDTVFLHFPLPFNSMVSIYEGSR